ncbi:MAG: ChaN family lipoprotein [Deltaproteobacteria bacterium]|nr:ChaN family lipoprotein [Deltaproteobacteria bacterium]
MKPSNQRLYDVNHGKETVMSDVIAALKQNRIIIVGEHHSNISHHEAQVNVIRSLKESGVQVAIGLEMFRSDSQPALDRWVAGDIGEEEFQEIFYDNWGYSWANYRVIFDYARAEKMPMIGLNVPRDITRQVARQGFQSLNKEQKGKLSNIACRVDKEYMDYIKKAFGGHAHGKLDFTYFCEAQLVWDTMMAINALEFLKKNPEAVVIVLTGTGHAQKNAIPRQIRERSDVAHAVILPEVKGVIDSKTVDKTVADYIILDL